MGGFENYAADDLYNMEDVWNEKPFKKVRNYSLGFFSLIHDVEIAFANDKIFQDKFMISVFLSIGDIVDGLLNIIFFM